jgi:hypothetical protein
MGTEDENLDGMDLRIKSEESDAGLREVKITALTQQGEIDLAMEYPRFLKLLERNWNNESLT